MVTHRIDKRQVGNRLPVGGVAEVDGSQIENHACGEIRIVADAAAGSLGERGAVLTGKGQGETVLQRGGLSAISIHRRRYHKVIVRTGSERPGQGHGGNGGNCRHNKFHFHTRRIYILCNTGEACSSQVGQRHALQFAGISAADAELHQRAEVLEGQVASHVVSHCQRGVQPGGKASCHGLLHGREDKPKHRTPTDPLTVRKFVLRIDGYVLQGFLRSLSGKGGGGGGCRQVGGKGAARLFGFESPILGVGDARVNAYHVIGSPVHLGALHQRSARAGRRGGGVGGKGHGHLVSRRRGLRFAESLVVAAGGKAQRQCGQGQCPEKMFHCFHCFVRFFSFSPSRLPRFLL